MPATQSQIVTWSLTAGDPPPVEVFNPTGRSNVIFLCDHGSNVIPQALNGLGLSEHLQHRHIAWDIGALEVARQLASRCDAPMIKCGYSRLVIDPNRFPGDPQSIPRISDGFEIPGNQNLGEAEIRYRSAAFSNPITGQSTNVFAICASADWYRHLFPFTASPRHSAAILLGPGTLGSSGTATHASPSH